MYKEELLAKLGSADPNNDAEFSELMNAAVISFYERIICDEFGISKPTLRRWMTGANQPHPAMRPSIFKRMAELLDKKLEQRKEG